MAMSNTISSSNSVCVRDLGQVEDIYKPKKHIGLFAHDLLEYLKKNAIGKENSIKIKDLVEGYWYCGTTRRNIELATEELRGAGIPLCSSCAEPYGIFLARNFAEAESWVRQIDHRFRAMAANRARALETLRALAAKEGIQLSLEFFQRKP